MRKFLLSLVLVAMAGFASAQSILFEHINNQTHESVGEILPGRHEIIADIDDMMELSIKINVTNLTDSEISILCVREVVSITEGAGNNFCFGNCFGDETSQWDVSLAPGTPVEFSAHFKPYDPMTWEPMAPGTEATIKYTFSERTLGEFTYEFYFKYDPAAGPYNPVSVAENYGKMLSNAYPNPATDVVNFDIDMQNVQSASIAIYNMMGQEVIRQNVNDSHVRINVSDLTDGIYFYSLIVNNQAVKTNKLVISK